MFTRNKARSCGLGCRDPRQCDRPDGATASTGRLRSARNRGTRRPADGRRAALARTDERIPDAAAREVLRRASAHRDDPVLDAEIERAEQAGCESLLLAGGNERVERGGDRIELVGDICDLGDEREAADAGVVASRFSTSYPL